MAYGQGAIVLATDPFGNSGKRPYLIISNSKPPFYGQEYIAAAITTTARSEAIELTAKRFKRGKLPRQSYISPWVILTLKDWMIHQQPAIATDSTVDETRKSLNAYLQT